MRYTFSSLLWPQTYLFPMLKGAAHLSLDSTLYALSIGDQGSASLSLIMQRWKSWGTLHEKLLSPWRVLYRNIAKDRD